MAKIIAKNKQHTGITASVSFVNGVGNTDVPRLIKWFKDHGYEVLDEGKPEEPENFEGEKPDDDGKPEDSGTPQDDSKPEDQAVDLGGMSVPKLKEYAAANGISLSGASTKLEIIAAIESQKG